MTSNSKLAELICPTSPLLKKSDFNRRALVEEILNANDLNCLLEIYWSANAPVKITSKYGYPKFKFGFTEFSPEQLTKAVEDANSFIRYCLNILTIHNGQATNIHPEDVTVKSFEWVLINEPFKY